MSSLQKDSIFDCACLSVMFSRVAIDIFSMSKIGGYATDLKSSASQLISRLRQRSRALARHLNFWLFWSFYPCRKIVISTNKTNTAITQQFQRIKVFWQDLCYDLSVHLQTTL